MRVLIIGSGGREHAMAYCIAQSPNVDTVFVAPGNAGTALEPKVTNTAIAVDDIAALCAFAQSQAIDITIVGPELPLSLGITDTFTAAGLACFGPQKAAAQLESSKAFSKSFMQRHHIPTAQFAAFTECQTACDYADSLGLPVVIKADGLAAGKGVVIAHTAAEAHATIKSMLEDNAFGDAGARVVVESFLQGEEISYMIITDGQQMISLPSSQDHKARDEGDTGPNTGGMGAYSPAPLVTPELETRILDEVITPTLHGLAADGLPYCGFLYAGLMISPDGKINVLEYNCRLGDPETQVILYRLKSCLASVCLAATTQGLRDYPALDWDTRPALGVVLAAAGYPADYPKGEIISGLDQVTNQAAKVFHAGTKVQDQQIVTAGGRVLCVVASAETLAQAKQQAYAVADTIHWTHQYYRRDIGHRALTESV